MQIDNVNEKMNQVMFIYNLHFISTTTSFISNNNKKNHIHFQIQLKI
jgi:hypothetical protein